MSVAEGAPRLVAFTGLPGTGKSSLAELLAPRLGAPVFAWDHTMAVLKRHGVLTDLSYVAYLEMGYDLIGMLVDRQLGLGLPVVTDCFLTLNAIEKFSDIARSHHAPFFLLDCVCTDADVHRARIASRRRAIPGWHEVDWAHVERMRHISPRLGNVSLRLDAARPLDDNLAEIHRVVVPGSEGAADSK